MRPKIALNKLNKSKILLGSLFILISTLLFSQQSTKINKDKCLVQEIVGSYYYPWFTPSRWKEDSKVLGHPLLGFYDSSSSEVIRNHINWAKYYGINFFIYSWLGTDLKAHEDEIRITNKFLKESQDQGMKVSALYETAISLAQNDSTDRIDFDKEMPSGQIAGDKFVSDMIYFAKKQSTSSNHIKNANCPIINLYLVRNFVNADPYFKKLKRRLRLIDKCLNMNADVVFWHNSKFPIVHSEKSSEEQWEWIYNNFSSIYGYNLYSHNIKTYGMEAKDEFSKFYIEAKDINERKWKKRAKSAGIKYIYSLQPGYDDRPLRGIKRPSIKPSIDFFLKDWGRILKRIDYGDKVFITSFNEWYEGTAIEPDTKNQYSLLEANKKVVESISNYVCR